MSEAAPVRAAGVEAVPAPATAAERPRALTPAETAWVVLLPCALAMAAAILLLGPPLGHLLVRPGSDALWPLGWWQTKGTAEPVKNGRYDLALLAPVVLAGAILLGARRPLRLRPRTVRALALAGQAGVLALVVAGAIGQHRIIQEGRRIDPVFGGGLLAAAAALLALALLALRRGGLAGRVARLARERPATRRACLALAAVFAAIWLLDGVATDAMWEDIGMLNWMPSGAYAVLDGRTLLVDAHILYAKLLPYPTALVLATFGATTLAFTLFMALLNLGALLAACAVLRRIVGSVYGLALFVPFVALSGTDHGMRLASIWPMRYGGAYLVAWLTARHVDGERPRRAWLVFLVAGLVTIDNLDFGLGALLGAVAALLCASPPRTLRELARLAGSVAGGVAGAVALVTAFTLVRAGRLPDPAVLLEWPRIFTGLGLLSLPLPTASLDLALYATLVAAIAVAAVRVARAARDVLLTSMLAWSGVFGLLAASYYVARPDDLKLVALFSAWGFAIALLTIVCVRALAAREWRAPTLAELLVLFAFALAVVSLTGMRSPVPRISAIARGGHASFRGRIAEPFVSRFTRRGDKVAILIAEGYRIAYDLGLDDVSPYESENAVVTRRQMATLVDAIERAHVRMLFTPNPGWNPVGDSLAPNAHLRVFLHRGYRLIATNGTMLAWRHAR
ncbi:MAG: hypothetical protein JSS99_03815 [Actinobacteria bacterium]|nr:hypothetical protein [Actinomycetota bacterium]